MVPGENPGQAVAVMKHRRPVGATVGSPPKQDNRMVAHGKKRGDPMTTLQWVLLFCSPSILVTLWLAWHIGVEALRDVLDPDVVLPSDVADLDSYRRAR